MKNKIYISIALFVMFIALLTTSSFAVSITEKTDSYKEGALIYGSTRFETDVVITAAKAYDAGVNEAKLNVALGKDLSEIKPVVPYFFDGASWYQITESEEEPAKPLTETQVKKVEENLNIFFVNNEEKSVEVKFEGNVDKDSLPSNVKYEDGKFIVPATTFNFTFTETKVVNGEEVVIANEVSTNVDKNVISGTEKEPVVEEPSKNYVAKVGNEYFEDLASAIAKATNANEVVLINEVETTKPIVINKEVTLDLNGKTIYNGTDIWNEAESAWSLISVRDGGNLTIKGNGTVKAMANDCYAIDVQDGGNVTIEDGKYVGNISAVYVYEGKATINGGDYSIQQLSEHNDYRFTLNCWDANYVAGTAKIIVNGGTFMEFDPANNLAEGPNTSFTPGDVE